MVYRRARHLRDLHAQIIAEGKTLIQGKSYDGMSLEIKGRTLPWWDLIYWFCLRLLNGGNSPLSPHDWADFFRYCALFEQSGIPIKDGLDTLLATFDKPSQKYLIVRLLDGLEKGQKLSATLHDYPSIHRNLIVGFLQAGEQDGRIAPYCLQLQRFFQQHDHFMQKRRRALLYPTVVLLMTMVLLGLVLFIVVPQFEPLWQLDAVHGTRKVHLSWSTQVLLYIAHEPLLCLGTMVGGPLMGGIGLGIGCALSSSFGVRVRRFLRMLPVVRFYDDFALSLCFGVIGALLQSGVDLKKALVYGGEVLKSPYLKDAYQTWCNRIQGGGSVAQSLTFWPYLSPIVRRFVHTGEVSGHLGDAFTRCADHLKERAERRIDSALDLLHPILLTVIGGILAWIATAFFLPLYDSLSVWEGGV